MSIQQSSHPSDPPVPWRYISRVNPDGEITYYQYPINNLIPCLPPSKPNALSQLLPHQSYIIAPHSIPSLSSRKVLLIINPCAGGHSIKNPISLQPFLQILSEVSLQYHQVTTQRAGHARSLISEFYENDQLFQYDLIAPVGGDGTLHEVVNGLVDVLMKITTQHPSKSLPTIAPVPGGTGNAVAHSMGLHTLQLAALNIVHGLRNLQQLSKPLPLFQYNPLQHSNKNTNIISVCGLQWGLPADADKGTLQWQNTIGEARYTLGAVTAILSKRVKRARIKIQVDPKLQDKCWQELLEQNDTLRKSKLLENGVTQLDECTYLLDGAFVQAVAWNWKDLAHGFQVTPLANLNEIHVFDFMVFQNGLSRLKMIDLLLKVEDGSFLKTLDGFRYFKAKKITFESIEGDFLTVDGETVPVQPCVMQVSQFTGKLNILDAFSDSD